MEKQTISVSLTNKAARFFSVFDWQNIAIKLYGWASKKDSMEAHYRLAEIYYFGNGVETNAEKEKYHLEQSRRHYTPSQEMWKIVKGSIESQSETERTGKLTHDMLNELGIAPHYTKWRIPHIIAASILLLIASFSYQINEILSISLISLSAVAFSWALKP
jgi:hypothetical protein